jgi:hypothetical protein
MNDLPTLGERVRALLINIAIFYVAFGFAANSWLPTGGLESVWLLSALALWFFGLLTAPYFLPPREALANAITAICILVTAEMVGVRGFQTELEVFRWIAVNYCAAVAVLALAALFLHARDPQSSLGRLSFRLTGIFGTGELLYTPPALMSIIGAYQTNLSTIAWLLILWTVFVVARPAERVLRARRAWVTDTLAQRNFPAVGTIDRIDHPNIVRVRLNRATGWRPGALFISAMPNGDQQFVLSLFTQVQGSEVVGTGLCVASIQERIDCGVGQVFESHSPEKAAEFLENLSGAKGAELIGFTVENSTIGTLAFEVATSSELAEGDVVFARISGRDVFYQILDAQTAEESFDQNPRGTHIVRAAQLGCYSPEDGFTKYPWLPVMNSPLFIARNRAFPAPILSPREFIIGNVPSTSIGVVANVDDIVEYHTAILGVTGTGKTELALEIVRETVARG